MAEKNKSNDKLEIEGEDKVHLMQLLKLREIIDDKRPKFVRQESWRYKRISERWRKPKGIDSKMRLRVKGWPKIVKVGYRGPRLVRGLHPSGYRDVLVHNLDELKGLDPKKDAARLASSLGAKKRAELLKKAKELGIKVLNPTGIKKVKEVETKE
ncbi:MAG: 50S ribosomal protein L32e [Nitrososphaerales archaeon]